MNRILSLIAALTMTMCSAGSAPLPATSTPQTPPEQFDTVTKDSRTWENYIGHTGFNGKNYDYKWRTIVRSGRFDPVTNSGYETAHNILTGNHLMFGSNTGYPGANDIEADSNILPSFLTAQEQTGGGNIKSLVAAQATKLLLARQEAGTDYTIYWQLGNEINNKLYSEAFKKWAAANGKLYPHPSSPPSDGSGESRTGVDHITTTGDTGYIGYMMEYYAGPAIEAIDAINTSLADNKKIVLLAGSLANSRNIQNRSWYRLLLNYKFSGTYCTGLKDKYFYQLVDGITHHYLFAEYRTSPDNTMGNGGKSRHQVLLDMFDTYVNSSQPGNRIKYIYTTEEIGNNASNSGRAAYTSIIGGLSYIDFALENGFSPEQLRVMYYGPEAKQRNKDFTTAAFSMNKLAEFMPDRILSRAPSTFAADNNPDLEKYAFTTDRDELLLAVTTPASASVSTPSPVDFSAITINGSGYSVVPGSVHLFTIDEYLTPGAAISSANGITTIDITDNKNRSNGSLTVKGGRITKFNGTLVLLLKKN